MVIDWSMNGHAVVKIIDNDNSIVDGGRGARETAQLGKKSMGIAIA